VAAGVSVAVLSGSSGVSADGIISGDTPSAASSATSSPAIISGDGTGTIISGDGTGQIISGDGTAQIISGDGATATLNSVAALGRVSPVTGNAPVVSYAESAASLDSKSAVPVVAVPSAPAVAPLKRTLTADLIVVAPSTLPSSLLAAIGKVPDVTAAEPVEAVRMRLNGTYTAVLGVDPSGFRSFAAKPTAASDALWSAVAGGGIAVSYTMGKLDNLQLGGTLTASGQVTKKLRVVAFGTLGIGGVNAVVSDAVARELGAPAGNAIVISVQGMGISTVASAVGKLLPSGAGVEQLVSVVTSGGSASGAAGSGPSTLSGASSSAINVMLTAAMSRRGLPYVWGGDGPLVFDCSGLVQWSFRQAGITMPRVAADQALTGPSVPVSQLQPGDLLFYHTDPSAPGYISHVTIFLGNGWMIEAPQPGENVKVVPADFGSEFAGAVRVNPAQAAAVAGRVA
jgi:cell wall-associated NlpC family hydrolase